MKKLFLTLILFAASVGVASAAYPVADLDNCRDQKECALYCAVPANKPACWAYSSLQKVLGDATPSAAPTITFPIPELGNCSSKEACRAYCEMPANKATCTEFALHHKISGIDKRYSSMVQAAKTVLGCTSIPECKAVCAQEENRDKCREFSLKFAPKEVKERVTAAEDKLKEIKARLGCDNPKDCARLCLELANRDFCKGIIGRVATPSGNLMELRRKLNANCDSEATCIAWCKEHPGLCPALNKLERPVLKPTLPILREFTNSTRTKDSTSSGVTQ